MTYKIHPIAAKFPVMGQDELKELAADIKANGQREDIVLFEGAIIDGRHRYSACRMAGVEPRYREFNRRRDGDDPLKFVISQNVLRRHLTPSQRAIVAAQLATMKVGRPKESDNGVSQQDAAEMLNVSPRAVRDAKDVLENAPKAAVNAILSGDKTVNEVKQELREKQPKPPKEFLDKTGIPVPAGIQDDWTRAEEFGDVLNQLHKIKLLVEKAVEDKDVVFREVNNTTVATLTNAWNDLRRVLPYAVCTTCQGHKPKECKLCKGRGWLSQFLYSNAVPQKVREIREKGAKKP